MSLEETIQQFFDKQMRSKAIRTIGVGTATEIQENSCTVLRDGQPELLDVRFHATEDTPGSRIVEIPADQSSVIYAIIDNQETEAMIIKCSEIEKVMMKVGELEYHIDENGVMIKCGNDSLGSVISGFIDEVKKIIVINGRSPNVVALNALKVKLNKILK
ncbi:MAG TPA: hypothetical protein VK541_17435 [Pedobacter sp.]|uniref:hypothetical protein n=1 Tax=Pedobacter sp. TaxID=1411316 RepID=UPI002C8A490A|nr:hypothetical protein [Pedobacter sp.]HMI04275.1 hypothetical protein [Pedobacter sp.]